MGAGHVIPSSIADDFKVIFYHLYMHVVRKCVYLSRESWEVLLLD